jgi:hypothetical protein
MSRPVSRSVSSSSSDTVIEPEPECASDTTLSDGEDDQDSSPANSQFPAYPIHLLSACSAADRAMCQYTQPLVVEKTDGRRGELYTPRPTPVDADGDGCGYGVQQCHVQQRGACRECC